MAPQESALPEVRREVGDQGHPIIRGHVRAQQQVLVDPDRPPDLAAHAKQARQGLVRLDSVGVEANGMPQHPLDPIEVAVQRREQRRSQRRVDVPRRACVPPERPRPPPHGAYAPRSSAPRGADAAREAGSPRAGSSTASGRLRS
jgi:hypothetical protein